MEEGSSNHADGCGSAACPTAPQGDIASLHFTILQDALTGNFDEYVTDSVPLGDCTTPPAAVTEKGSAETGAPLGQS